MLTKGNIVFAENGKITSKKNGSIILKAGMEPGEKDIYDSTVKFEGTTPQVEILGEGRIKIYYNPTEGKKDHKYKNPTNYSESPTLETYMLVNDIYDLQGITACLFGSYALNQDIDASPTKTWNEGFFPIKEWGAEKPAPFSGIFDGNNYVIKNLYINRPNEEMVGLFGDITGVNRYRAVLRNLIVENAVISGKRCVGVVFGQATEINMLGIFVNNSKIRSEADFGKVGGCVLVNKYKSVSSNNTFLYKNGIKSKTNNKLFGSCVHCEDNSQ